MENKRYDGYYNAVIGHGLHSRDPGQHWKYSFTELMSDQLLADMYSGNGLARRIVDLPADESVKNWITLSTPDENTISLMLGMLDDLNAEMHFADAIRWARLYGGSLMLLLANDGGTLQEPLQKDRIMYVESLKVYDRTEVTWNYANLYSDPQNPKFGSPEFYEITPVSGNTFRVHESRTFKFIGAPIPHRYNQYYQNWGMPVLQGLMDDIRNCCVGYGNAGLLLERISQAIYKITDLGAMLETSEGEELVMKRIQLIDMARSILNTIVIDMGEDFDLKNTSLAQVPQILDQFGVMVSGLSGIPYTLLFGTSPAGMNATGESDLENYYNMVRQIQKRQIKKPLDTLVQLLFLSKEGPFNGREPEDWKLEFMPLWLPSEKEKAETEKLKAETDKIKSETAKNYVDAGALDPQEVRKKLAEEKAYDIEGELDEMLEEDPEGR